MKGLPTRCIDPVMKCCQDCAWGYREYGDDVECSADLAGCCFESGCTECGSNFFLGGITHGKIHRCRKIKVFY